MHRRRIRRGANAKSQFDIVVYSGFAGRSDDTPAPWKVNAFSVPELSQDSFSIPSSISYDTENHSTERERGSDEYQIHHRRSGCFGRSRRNIGTRFRNADQHRNVQPNRRGRASGPRV